MRIAQVVPPWVSIPPIKYGGVELVVSSLIDGLAKRGHKVTLFASGDSKSIVNELVSVNDRGLFEENIIFEENHNYTLLLLEEVFKRANEFDIIHLHVGPVSSFFKSSTTPVLNTIHTYVDSYQRHDGRILVYKLHPNNNYVSVSKSQQRKSQVKVNYIANVYNGLDSNKYKFNDIPDNKFIWIGNFFEIKGPEIAINLAERFGMRLDLAGKIHEAWQREYFEKRIKIRLNDKIRYVGEISQSQKSSFFGSAKCLIYPVQFDEPFGLVMIEAMACGTPVIAYSNGSVREIVKNNISGIIVKNFIEMCNATTKIEQIDRKNVRKWFDNNFTSEKMTDNYLRIYEKLIKNKRNFPIQSNFPTVDIISRLLKLLT